MMLAGYACILMTDQLADFMPPTHTPIREHPLALLRGDNSYKQSPGSCLGDHAAGPGTKIPCMKGPESFREDLHPPHACGRMCCLQRGGMGWSDHYFITISPWVAAHFFYATGFRQHDRESMA